MSAGFHRGQESVPPELEIDSFELHDVGAGNLTQVPSPALRVLQEKANIHNSLGALCSFLGFAKPVTTSAYLFFRNLLRSYFFPLLILPSRTCN